VTYTRESDRKWPQVIDAINLYLEHYTRKAFKRKEKYFQETVACLENHPISNSSLDKASLDDIRIHFASWSKTQDRHPDEAIARFTTFLVVEEVALNKIARTPRPDDPNARASDRLDAYVLVVSASHEAGRRLPSLTSARKGVAVQEGKLFPEYMKVPLPYLQELWVAAAEYMDLYEICRSEFDKVPEWMP